jgi:hypothetical protein
MQSNTNEFSGYSFWPQENLSEVKRIKDNWYETNAGVYNAATLRQGSYSK